MTFWDVGSFERELRLDNTWEQYCKKRELEMTKSIIIDWDIYLFIATVPVPPIVFIILIICQ